jgi:hypothetical protein
MTLLYWLPCYIGNEIEHNAKKFSSKAFATNWIDLKNRKNTVVVQTILQMSFGVIQMAEFVPLNITSFLKCLHFTYSMVAFLRSFK